MPGGVGVGRVVEEETIRIALAALVNVLRGSRLSAYSKNSDQR
jgi:hypothetical protein